MISSTFTGWFISWLIIKILFWPVKPIWIGRFKIQGLIASKQQYFADKIGSRVQAAFIGYKGLDEKFSDPALLEKLKPEIEVHVDHFLREKLKTVFPILAQFMGEKTISQFKNAFLTEIDNLLPVLIRNYMNEMKNEIRLDRIISEKINMLPMSYFGDLVYSNTIKERKYFSILCAAIGLLTGIITVIILLLINI